MEPFSHELNHLLTSTYHEISRTEELILRNLSNDMLSISELHILDVVGRSGCTVTDIAQNMCISMPSATIAVKKLEKKGYITKERDEDDARRVCIRLTTLGRRAYTAHLWFHRQMVQHIERAFCAEERELLLTTIRRLEGFFKTKAHELEESWPLGSSAASSEETSFSEEERALLSDEK